MREDLISSIGGTHLVAVEFDRNARQPLTIERLNATYENRAYAPMFNVFSVGSTPIKALTSLGKRIGWGKLTKFESQPEVNEELGEWYYRFHADGTSMKAAGFHLPGGVIVTWWK